MSRAILRACLEGVCARDPCPLPSCSSSVVRRGHPAGSARQREKVITHDVYDSAGESIQGTGPADGTWIAYADAQKATASSSFETKTNAEIRAPRGCDPLMTSDNTFVVRDPPVKRRSTSKEVNVHLPTRSTAYANAGTKHWTVHLARMFRLLLQARRSRMDEVPYLEGEDVSVF